MEKNFIYTLSNPITKEIKYIGKTFNIKRRLYGHLSKHSLLKRSKKNSWIKSLINKKLLPIIEILDEVEKSESNFYEIFYISLFKSWGFKLLNMTEGGDGNHIKGRKNSEEYKIKQKINSPNRKSVGQYDLEGNLIKTYYSISEAAKYTNSNRTHISNCCNNRKSSITHNWFIWKFIEKNDFNKVEEKIIPIKKYEKTKRKKITKEKVVKENFKIEKPKLPRPNITKIKVFTLNGELLEICNGYRDIEEKYKCHRELVSRCCKEKGFYQTKNLTFRYENDYFDYVPYKNFRNNKTYKIGLYKEDGELIKSFNSLKDAVSDTKIGKQYISKNCNDNLDGNNNKVFNRKKEYFIFKFLYNPYDVR